MSACGQLGVAGQIVVIFLVLSTLQQVASGNVTDFLNKMASQL